MSDLELDLSMPLTMKFDGVVGIIYDPLIVSRLFSERLTATNLGVDQFPLM